MNVQSDVDELAYRFLAIVVGSFHFARRWSDWAAVLEKIQAVSEELVESDLSFEAIRPLLQEVLTERFDRETADRLTLEFSDLFSVIAASTPSTVGHRGESWG